MQRQVAKLICCLGCWSWSVVARAETNSCASAYEQAQELRADLRLRSARTTLAACVAPECSEFVRTECGRWLAETEASLASVVLAVRRSGSDLENVRVLFDQEPLVERIDGKSVFVDPGPHTLTFVVEGSAPVELKAVFREGERNRLVTVELPDPVPLQPAKTRVSEPTPVTKPSSVGWLPYAIGGVGVAGVAGFATLGILGNRELADRERTCAPSCSNGQVSSVRTKYYLADLSLGVGVISLGLAGYLFLTAPRTSHPSATERTPLVAMQYLPGGAFAAVRSEF